jgi:WD40 repeat protein/serine/threonine protein kinase
MCASQRSTARHVRDVPYAEGRGTMNERVIFSEALDKPDPTEQAAYLDEACAGDPDAQRRIEVLLRAHAAAGDFLEEPAVQQLAVGTGTPADRGDSEDHGGGSGRSTAGIPLDFLDPPRRPDSLGRLGHYEILEVTGQGGMGVVLRAFDEKLHRVVAIKALTPALAITGSARQRFVREARAAAAVTHDNVIAIHAVEDQGAVPYLVMQFIDGPTLKEKLSRAEPLPVPEVLRIGIQVAAGLAAAHAHGLVHRDVKPENILLENGIERVKITDFGLARAADDASLTQSGIIAGTPAYMSPEQANGESVDQRSDLFSLGSVLYALCTGRGPFRGSTTVAVLKRVCDETPRPIREVNADVPEWLAAIIAKLHAKSAADRYQSAAEVANLLSRHLADLQRPGLILFQPLSTRAAVGGPAVGATRYSRRLVASSMLFGLVAIAVFWSLARPDRSKAPDRVRIAPAREENPRPRNAPWKPRPPLTPDELAKWPSPLDALKRAAMELPAEAPAELVALLGKSPYLQMPGTWNCHWMAQTRDGRLLAIPYGSGVELFDAHTGRWLRTLTGHTSRAYRPDFSPDGKRLASGEDNSIVRVWDVATGREEFALKGHDHPVWCLAFDHEGKRLVSAGSDGTIKVWDAEGHLANSFQGHNREINYVGFSPDGKRLATASNDGNCKLWDRDDWHEIRSLPGSGSTFEAVAWSQDGRSLAAADETTVTVWSAATYDILQTLKTPGKGLLAFSPDGQALWTARHDCSQGERHAFTRWDVATGARKATIQLPTRGGTCVFLQLSPDGRTVFVAQHDPADPQLQAYDAETGRELFPHPRHHGAVRSLVFDRDRRMLASGSADRTVRLWDLAGWRPAEPVPPTRTLDGHSKAVYTLAFSPDGQWLVSAGEDGLLNVWESSSGRKIRDLSGHALASSSVAFSSDGSTIAAGNVDGTLDRWDVSTWGPREPIHWHTGSIRALAYSPDGRWLASGGTDATVQVIDAATGRRWRTFRSGAAITELAFSPSGRTLAAVSDEPASELRLWDLETNAERVLASQIGRIVGLSFHPAGRWIATASLDRTIRLWDLSGPTEGARVVDFRAVGEPQCVTFSPEGRHLLVGLADGLIAIARVTPRLADSAATTPAVR